MAEKTYQLSGFMYGTFPGNNGSPVEYANLYCLQKMTGEQRENFKYDGHIAYKFKCESPEVIIKSGVKAHDTVELYFNHKQRVNMIVVVK